MKPFHRLPSKLRFRVLAAVLACGALSTGAYAPLLFHFPVPNPAADILRPETRQPLPGDKKMVTDELDRHYRFLKAIAASA